MKIDSRFIIAALMLVPLLSGCSKEEQAVDNVDSADSSIEEPATQSGGDVEVPDPQPVAAYDRPQAPLPELNAFGNEPAWKMTWDGNTMSISYGVNSIVRNPFFQSEPSSKVWTFNEGDKFVVLVEEKRCTDEAEEEHFYDVTIQLKNGRRLVGCGDPAYSQP